MYLAKTNGWYLERAIWLVAGTFALSSAVLAWLHSPLWLLLTALVGVNLIVFGLTGFCVMANILVRLGFRSHISDHDSLNASAPQT